MILVPNSFQKLARSLRRLDCFLRPWRPSVTSKFVVSLSQTSRPFVVLRLSSHLGRVSVGWLISSKHRENYRRRGNSTARNVRRRFSTVVEGVRYNRRILGIHGLQHWIQLLCRRDAETRSGQEPSEYDFAARDRPLSRHGIRRA